MKGHSGDVFERVGPLVTKASFNVRLLEQARRQKEFTTSVPLLSACPVLGTASTENAYSFTMPHIDGVCPLYAKTPLLTPIFEYIHERLLQSTVGDVPADVMLGKLQSVERQLLARHTWATIPDGWQEPLRQCEVAFNQGLKDVPLGACHGDLTFTNMLQTKTGLVLFDFLDNVFDSVLLDMVKLRQDTAHLWANVVLKYPIDGAVLKRIDYIVASELRWYECYRRYYRALQQFNLLRILPYCRDIKTTNHVLTELNVL